MGNENKTSWLFDKDDEDPNEDLDFAADEGFTESISPSDNEPTHAVGGSSFSEAPTEYVESDKTQIYHGGMSKDFANKAEFDPMVDPITGWLVVVKGPGLGQSVNLGSGMNTLGRDGDERVSMDFGDKLISGKDHLRIIFDDANRVFFTAPGTGRNISRVNGQIVAATMPLENYALIELSKQTHVRFVAFCNEDFDWSELAESTDD
ncbi:FHA domain-containing protein [Ruegeria sp. EL01]|uniref:FHA domain-containing protein n=1 Tax=Ruegeria sp. EL01 TaxID=2107578 RepID=UPI001C1F6A2A|nr:FHA domain-containing protein [Ruegeria sp. EL01]